MVEDFDAVADYVALFKKQFQRAVKERKTTPNASEPGGPLTMIAHGEGRWSVKELTLVLVRLDHVASRIVNADHGIGAALMSWE